MLLVGWCLAGLAVGAPETPSAGQFLPPFTIPVERHDEIPAARAVVDHLQQTLDLIDADLPRIVEAAELLAAAAGHGACEVRGDVGFVGEMTGAGSWLAADVGPAAPTAIIAAVGWGDSTADGLRAELDAIDRAREGGRAIVLIASVEMLRALDLEARARLVSDVLLDDFAPRGGLLRTVNQPSTEDVIRMESVTACVVGWTLQVEMAAAQARRAWDATSATAPVPAPMRAGHDYLHALGSVLEDMATASWPSLVRAADRAATTIADGGRVLAVSTQPLVAAHARRRLAADPLLILWTHPDQVDRVAPGGDDMVLAFGADEPVGAAAWGQPAAIRRAGRGVCWITCAFGSWDARLKRGEWRLDPRWPYGDGLIARPVVNARDRDHRMAPAAGVVAETIYWLLNAAVLERLDQLRTPTVQRGPAPRQPAVQPRHSEEGA